MKKTNMYIYGSLIFISLLFFNQQIQISYLKKLAQQDLDFARQIILQNHPQLNNNENIQLAYNAAQKEIITIRSSTDHIKSFKNYIAIFKDTQICFIPKNSIDFSTTSHEADMINNSNKNDLIVALPSNIGDIQVPIK